MKIISIVTFLFVGLNIDAQTDSVKGNQYSLKGKLINEINLTPHCGTIAWGTVIEFEIIEFSDLTYSNKNIAVIFNCPEFYKNNFFEPGKIYEILLADENQADFSWIIPNEKLLEKYKLKSKLWVIKTE